jgi:flagellar basal-body rod protein FlgF
VSRDVYSSLSGATAVWRQLEVTANNLSNSTTAGFKEQRTVFAVESTSTEMLGDSLVRVDELAADFSDGALQMDGIQTHLALRGRGFMVTLDDQGGEILLRSAALTQDEEGRLMTEAGDLVQGQGGEIQLEQGLNYLISEDGSIRDSNGDELDRLKLLDADELEPLGGARWRAVGETREAEVRVIQGGLEASNADPLRGMTELVEISHFFELYQKAMQTSDQMDEDVNGLGRSR